MDTSAAVAGLTLIAVMLIMGGEAALSAYNERGLRARGAVEPAHDVYRTMQWAYPGLFILMAVEGAARGPAPQPLLVQGLAVFGLAKALKMSAISALGSRWTFRVLVLRDAPLVTSGPYRFVRHPNYLAVLGELLGVAMIVYAPITGAMALLSFGWLMRKRIQVEDQALGRTR